jgi:type IV secretory pathway VirB2 component (pilin)
MSRPALIVTSFSCSFDPPHPKPKEPSMNPMRRQVFLAVAVPLLLLLTPLNAFAAGGGGGPANMFIISVGTEIMGILQGPLVKWLCSITAAGAGIKWIHGGHHAKDQMLGIFAGATIVAMAGWFGDKLGALIGFTA